MTGRPGSFLIPHFPFRSLVSNGKCHARSHVIFHCLHVLGRVVHSMLGQSTFLFFGQSFGRHLITTQNFPYRKMFQLVEYFNTGFRYGNDTVKREGDKCPVNCRMAFICPDGQQLAGLAAGAREA